MSKLTIDSLYVKNFKGIREIKIIPEGNVILITGGNGEGKTSILDALFETLKGGRQETTSPIRNGEKRSVIEIIIGEYKVEKIIAKKSTRLDIYYKGAVQKRPQEVLNDLIGSIGFDVRKFMDKSQSEQRKMLMQLIGLDFTELDEQRDAKYEKRTIVGKAGKELAQYNDTDVAKAQKFEKIELKNVNELIEEWKHEDEKDNDKADSIQVIKMNVEKTEDYKKDIIVLEDKIRQLNDSILAKVNKNMELEKVKDSNGKATKLKEEINTVEKTNDEIRKNHAILENDKLVRSKQDEYTKLTDEVKAIDDQKIKELRESKMPLKGLSINETEILYNDVPFQQLSTSEQLDVSLAMGMSKKDTNFKVLRISDGDKFDEKNLEKISKAIKDNDWQVWIEKVSNTKRGFHIIDGELA